MLRCKEIKIYVHHAESLWDFCFQQDVHKRCHPAYAHCAQATATKWSTVDYILNPPLQISVCDRPVSSSCISCLINVRHGEVLKAVHWTMALKRFMQSGCHKWRCEFVWCHGEQHVSVSRFNASHDHVIKAESWSTSLLQPHSQQATNQRSKLSVR